MTGCQSSEMQGKESCQFSRSAFPLYFFIFGSRWGEKKILEPQNKQQIQSTQEASSNCGLAGLSLISQRWSSIFVFKVPTLDTKLSCSPQTYSQSQSHCNVFNKGDPQCLQSSVVQSQQSGPDKAVNGPWVCSQRHVHWGTFSFSVAVGHIKNASKARVKYYL